MTESGASGDASAHPSGMRTTLFGLHHHCTDWTHTMTNSTLGLLAGLLLGIAAAVGGFGAFLLALVLGVLGYIIGGALDGKIEVGALLRGKGRG